MPKEGKASATVVGGQAQIAKAQEFLVAQLNYFVRHGVHVKLGTGSGGSPLLEALPAEDWPALRWLEGDGGLFSAGGTVGPSFHAGPRSWRSHRS
jgi:hypothetical protein